MQVPSGLPQSAARGARLAAWANLPCHMPLPPPQNPSPHTPKLQDTVLCACLHACVLVARGPLMHSHNVKKMHGTANPCKRAPKTPKSLKPKSHPPHTNRLWGFGSKSPPSCRSSLLTQLDCLDCGRCCRREVPTQSPSSHTPHTLSHKTHTVTHTHRDRDRPLSPRPSRNR